MARSFRRSARERGGPGLPVGTTPKRDRGSRPGSGGEGAGPYDDARATPYDDARVNDILHAPGTAREVRGLLAIEKRHGASAHRGTPTWMEPACGTGRYLRAIASLGHNVVGFDRSATLLEYARRRLAGYGRHVQLFQADMEAFADRLRPRSVDFAFNLDNTIRHLQSDAALVRHLEQIEQVLKPGGVYAVGLSLTRYGAEEITEDFWSASRGRTRVELLVQYFPPGTGMSAMPGVQSSERWEDVVQHRIVTRPTGVEHADFRYRLRCHDRRQWERLLRRAGLTPVAVVDATGSPVDPDVYDYAIHILGRQRAGDRLHGNRSSAPGRARPPQQRDKTSPLIITLSTKPRHG